jgi:hypothetical protein
VAAVVRNVAAVGEDVNAQLLAAVCNRAVQDTLELIVARVHATRAEQGDEVHCVGLKRRLDVLPASVVEDRLILDGDVDKGCSLRDNLTGAESVVTNL